MFGITRIDQWQHDLEGARGKTDAERIAALEKIVGEMISAARPRKSEKAVTKVFKGTPKTARRAAR